MLQDLDELVSTCADPRSRAYIRESVLCYKAGAYRSSVVACWIAVVFDVLDKLREIAANGDAAAKIEIAKFDRARADDDIRFSQDFERRLPELARTFEFISPVEMDDLSRLAADRNRCAHPSQVSDAEVFEALPELARLHIVNSVRSILSQPAAQGKSALDRLLVEHASNAFPSKPEDILFILESGPLKRPREALFRNYCSVLLKALFKTDPANPRPPTSSKNALLALRKMHPEMWNKVVEESLSSIVSSMKGDGDFSSAAVFFGTDKGKEFWECLDPVNRMRMVSFVEKLPRDELDSLDDLLKTEELPLYAAASFRVGTMPEAEIFSSIWFSSPEPLLNRLAHLYSAALDDEHAEEFGDNISKSFTWFGMKPKHFEQFAQVGFKNRFVRRSPKFAALLRELATSSKIKSEEIDRVLEQFDLKHLDWL